MGSELRFCDQCGYEAGSEARFCPRCGNQLQPEGALEGTPVTLSRGQPVQPLSHEQGAQLARSLQGRSGARWWRGRTLKVMVAVAGVMLIFGLYNAAAVVTYSRARDAHRDLNCAAALGGYGRVAGFFALSLATSRSEAIQSRAECREVLKAEEFRRRGEHESAAEAYEAALDENPDSPISATLERWRGEELLAEASGARRTAFLEGSGSDLGRAVGIYWLILRELSGSEAAAGARAALDEIGTLLYRRAKSVPCKAVPLYDGLDSESVPLATAGHPLALYGCANARFSSKRYALAKSLYSRLIVDFPSSPLTARARRGLIAAEVALIRTGGTGQLPDPTIVGNTASGMVEVSVQNSSPYRLELLLSGPDAKRLEVPACGSCKKYLRAADFPGRSGPKRSITVEAGRYAAVVRSTSSNARPWSDDWTLVGGYRYDSGCFYIVTGAG